MIQVYCANCKELFEVDEASAGGSEFCPACGALNDVMIEEYQEDDTSSSSWVPPTTGPSLQPQRRGLSAVIWWMLALIAVAVFAGAYWLAVSDDWETAHLQQMTDIAGCGDALWSHGDFAGASRQYDLLIATVGDRKLRSDYLRDLLSHARQGVKEAALRQIARPATAASVAAQIPSTAPADTEAAFSIVRKFQRDADQFTQFVADHPVVYLDEDNKWRRRRWVIWDVAYDLPPPSGPQQILLQYSCGAQRTGPHYQRDEALSDIDFRYDDVATERCQTLFNLGQIMRVVRNEGGDQPGDALKLREVWDLVAQAFGAKASTQPE